jgi:hypothetical protein
MLVSVFAVVYGDQSNGQQTRSVSGKTDIVAICLLLKPSFSDVHYRRFRYHELLQMKNGNVCINTPQRQAMATCVDAFPVSSISNILHSIFIARGA